MYYDHHYVGDQVGPCEEQVLKFNKNWDHDFLWDNRYCRRCNSQVQQIDLGEGVSQSKCNCSDDDWLAFNRAAGHYGPYFMEVFWICGNNDCRKPQMDTVHMSRDYANCGAQKHSVLHDPEDFGHWCSILDAGGDCMHLEDI